MAPLESISGDNSRPTYSSKWDEDLDDLLKDIDSPTDKKKYKAGKSKLKRKKSPSGRNKKGRALDESNDSLFEGSESYSSRPLRNEPDFDLSIASDLGNPGNKGGDLLGDLVTSKDLEDSILGGFVGGFKKPGAASATTDQVKGSSKVSSPAVRVPKPYVLESSESFGDMDIPIFDKEKRSGVANIKATDSTVSARATGSLPNTTLTKDLEESESFDDADLPIFGNDASRPRTATSASSARNRPMQKSTTTKYDESDSFDNNNLPIFDKQAKPSGPTRKNRSPSPKKASPVKNTLEDSASFDEMNLPIFGGSNRQSSGPLGERTKILSPAGSKKDILAASRGEVEPITLPVQEVMTSAVDRNASDSSEAGNKSAAMPFIPSFYDTKPRSRRYHEISIVYILMFICDILTYIYCRFTSYRVGISWLGLTVNQASKAKLQ